MRTLILTLALVLGWPTVTEAAGDCPSCDHPNCQCTDCDKGCRCCGPDCSATAGTNATGQSEGPRFSPSKTPVTTEGIRVTTDLPAALHKRNTGGMGRGGPGTGAGLCVYTSAWHALMWQNQPAYYGFRDWMKDKPGGSWPEKFDKTIRDYCREKGLAVPGYVQHTGGDADFLKAALRSGRMVCVTYAGRDDFYRDRWGRPAAIAHMVNLVYLDDKVAVIVDNNRPGVFLRMSNRDFMERWLAMSGGWAFAFTAPPPPPYATKPAQEFLAAPAATFLVDEGADENPEAAPNLPDAEVMAYNEAAGKAKERGLVLVTFVGQPAKAVHGCLVARTDNLAGFQAGDVVVSKWVDGKHVGVKTHLGARRDAANWVAEVDRAVAQLDPENRETIRNFGVDFTRIARERRYSFMGEPVSKEQALDRFKLPDDAGLKSLTFAGPSAYIRKAKAAVDGMPRELREKFLVQLYETESWNKEGEISHWAVDQFGIKPGVTIRDADAPTIDRVGKELGHQEVGDLTTELLVILINSILNPEPPKPEPIPVPPKPVDPKPAPVDPPPPPPTPEPKITVRDVVQLLVVAWVIYLLYRNRQPVRN